MCRKILQMEFHHVPSSQGKGAELSDNDCYEKTKELYQKESGYTPSSLYWPQLHKSKLNKFHFSFISILCAMLLTVYLSTMFSDVELILKWAIGIYVVYKILSWLDKGGTA